MDSKLCFKGILNPFFDTVLVFGPINVSPHFCDQFQVLQLWRVVAFRPSPFPNTFEQILALLFSAFVGEFVIFDHLIVN